MKKSELRALIQEQVRKVLKEALIGPFSFDANTPDEELIAMYHGALDGFSNYKPGMHFKRTDYRMAYQAIEKLLKQKGIAITESKLTEADMTRNYDGFKVLNSKTKKLTKFRYVKGRKNTDVENEAIAKLMKATGLQRANFGVHGFVRKGEYDKDTTPDFVQESTIKEFGPLAGSGNSRANDLDNIKREASRKSERGETIYVVGAKNGSYKLSKYFEEGNTYAAFYNGMPQVVEGLGKSINEDAGMVADVAMGVAAGLMGLWTIVQGAPAVVRVFGDAADYLADKAEKKAKAALKNQRKETIAPIIAKFKNDSKLAAMYQALPDYDALISKNHNANIASNKARKKGLIEIGNYIKSKLTPEEMQYFRDISSMLRDGDLK